MGRGVLTFKGESPKKKKKKSKHAPTAAAAASPEQAGAKKPAAVAAAATKGAPKQPRIVTGTGRITTSGTVVTGHETRFSKEIHVGDAIVVGGGGEQGEMRVVTMRLSDVSLNLSSAFSQSYATPTSFQYISKPRNTDASREASAREQAAMEEQHSFGIYGGGGGSSSAGATNELVYREKTEHGSYRIKRVKVDGTKDRADLLAMRTKKKSDKYC